MGLMDKMEQAVISGGYIRRTTKVEGEMVKLLPPRQGRPEIEFFEKGPLSSASDNDTAGKVLEPGRTIAKMRPSRTAAILVPIMSRCWQQIHASTGHLLR